MMTVGFLAVLIGLVVAGVMLLRRSHVRWLAQQSPVGVWITSTPAGRVLLQFEGERSEGTYRQLTEVGSERTREWGHWSHDSGHLRLLVMATDLKDHPRFGVDTAYRVRYVAPNRITIDGPDRSALLYERAPAGTSVNIE
jgi:hypothetical protein